MGQRFLGLDSSTQSLTGVVIDWERREIVCRTSLRFDEELPQYGTRNGVLPEPEPGVVHAPPLLWVEALDLLFGRLRQAVDPATICALAVSGQQHGSVYLGESAPTVLSRLADHDRLVSALAPVLTRPTSPVWMDSSTERECDEIRVALGGALAASRLTGSDVFERFTGPQIRRFAALDPEGYAATAHIGLVSSFVTSVLAGRLAPIDHGDGAGMSLMDLRGRRWSDKALAATAPDLGRRLPPLQPAQEPVGSVSPYFVERYGVREDALVLAGTGDNPSSTIGVGLVAPGPMVVSLGTSDTCFALLEQEGTDPSGLGHVFVAPTGAPMALLCFHNGSLARERVRDRYGLDWRGFSEALRATPPGNEGRLMLPYFEPEIVPRTATRGVLRSGGLEEEDGPANCRAVVEAQMLTMRLHSGWIEARPTRILATGGGSENRDMLEVMAAVFGCPVRRFEVSDSAALGAALRAAHGWLLAHGRPRAWDEIVAGFVPGAGTGEALTGGDEIEPDPGAVPVYERALEAYAALEARALASASRTGPPS